MSTAEGPTKNRDSNFSVVVVRHIAGSLAATIVYAVLLYFLTFLTEALLSKGMPSLAQNGYEELVVLMLIALPLFIFFPTFAAIAALTRLMSKPEIWRTRRYQIWVAALLSATFPLAATLYSEPWSLRTVGMLLSLTLPIPIMASVFGSVTGLVNYVAPVQDQALFPDMPKEWNEI